MESLLGFNLVFWDYATAVVLLVCIIAGLPKLYINFYYRKKINENIKIFCQF